MTYDTAELKRLMEPLKNRLPLVIDKDEIWTAEQTFEVDGDVDQYRSYLASCGSNTFGALAVAAVNALPDLLARVEELEGALEPFVRDEEHFLGRPDNVRFILKPNIGDLRRARAALKGGAV